MYTYILIFFVFAWRSLLNGNDLTQLNESVFQKLTELEYL